MKSGINLTHLAQSVRPQDDLYRHVNGAWLADAVIPDDRAIDGAFHALRDLSEVNIRDIVEEAAASNAPVGTDAQRIGDLYRSFMNEDAIEALGFSPIAEDLALVDDVTDLESFARVLGELEYRGSSGLIGMWITADYGDPSTAIAYLHQDGLGLPDESYYREEQHAELRDQYVAHVARTLSLVGHADAQEAAERVMAFETALAAKHIDNVKRRDAVANYNKHGWDEFRTLLSGFDVDTWRTAARVPEAALATLVVREMDYFHGLSEVLAGADAQTLRDWLTWNIVRDASAYLSSEFVNASFDFFGNTLTGQPQIRDRWKRGISLVEGLLGEAAGKLYVDRHFPPAAKDRMVTLVANLIAAYEKQIKTLDWMTDETKVRALEKLSKFTPKIGYPDKWRDYSALTITEGDLMANIRNAGRIEAERQFAKIGEPLDRSEWMMTPQTVNAYYSPGMNEIVFPAAILQPPFFDMDADDAVNYGGIGAVIGHEIGHGFDDQGSRYDGDGNLKDWWTEADRTEFNKRVQMLIDQYNVLEPAETPGSTVNGALTVGENIGDLGGLSIAYVAYDLARDGEQGPALDGLSADQRFFFGWAQVWATAIRPQEASRRLQSDPHSPAEFRCNAIVRNVPSFYEAFAVEAGDALWLEPDQRVRIW